MLDLVNYMFEDFARYDPESAKKAVKWYEFERLEIMIELNDGSKILYDFSDKVIRYLGRGDREDLDEEHWRMEFAKRLYKRMLYRGINQQALSEKSGISMHTISKYMNGYSTPSFYNADRLAKALGCTVLDLLHFPK